MGSNSWAAFFDINGEQEKSIANEIVLITGAGGFLGRALAVQLAKRAGNGTTTKFVLWDVDESANKKTADLLILGNCLNVFAFTVDLRNKNEIESVTKQVQEQVGYVTLVIMAAAPSFTCKSVLDTDFQQDIQKHFEVSYLSQLWTIQELIKPMLKTNHGHFVTISSLSSLIDMPLVSSYASFKSAQVKLIESLSEELHASSITGIRTSVVFMSMADGGLAKTCGEPFKTSQLLDMTTSTLTSEEVSELIVSGVLKDNQYIYAPASTRFLHICKAVSPQLAHFIFRRLVTPKSQYLINKND